MFNQGDILKHVADGENRFFCPRLIVVFDLYSHGIDVSKELLCHTSADDSLAGFQHLYLLTCQSRTDAKDIHVVVVCGNKLNVLLGYELVSEIKLRHGVAHHTVGKRHLFCRGQCSRCLHLAHYFERDVFTIEFFA